MDSQYKKDATQHIKDNIIRHMINKGESRDKRNSIIKRRASIEPREKRN